VAGLCHRAGGFLWATVLLADMSGWRRRLRDVVEQVRAPRPTRGDWRRAGRLAALALVVVSFAGGGVQLADPFRPVPEHRTVDTDAAPARVAYQAMRQTERGSYVLERYIGNGTARRQVAQLRIDTADRQVRGTLSYRRSAPSQAVYGSDAGTWRRPTDGESGWTYADPGRRTPDLFRSESAVLSPDADVSVASRNATTLVVRVNDTDTAFLLARGWENYTGDRPDARASLTLALDREAGVIRWSRFRWSVPDDDGTRDVQVTVERFRRWGAVEVNRPRGLPYTFDAVLFDLVDRCPDCRRGDG